MTLVGLFPLHTGHRCEKIVSVKNYNGFQRMEAFVLALEKVNNHIYNSEVFIEAILYDTCSDSLAEYVGTLYLNICLKNICSQSELLIMQLR